jgi:hypothetical protein
MTTTTFSPHISRLPTRECCGVWCGIVFPRTRTTSKKPSIKRSSGLRYHQQPVPAATDNTTASTMKRTTQRDPLPITSTKKGFTETIWLITQRTAWASGIVGRLVADPKHIQKQGQSQLLARRNSEERTTSVEFTSVLFLNCWSISFPPYFSKP